jgi:hypothetical protein
MIINGKRCIGGGCIFLAAEVAMAVLTAALPAAADPPTPISVLFVAGGYYVQETQIEQHLLATGAFTVTRMRAGRCF